MTKSKNQNLPKTSSCGRASLGDFTTSMDLSARGYRPGSGKLLHLFSKLLFVELAIEAVQFSSIIENQQAWDAENVVLRGYEQVRAYVYPAESYLGIAFGEHVQDWDDLLAGMAPRGAEKEKERGNRISYQLFEVCICDLSNHQGLPSPW